MKVLSILAAFAGLGLFIPAFAYADSTPLTCATCIPATGDIILKLVLPILLVLIICIIVLIVVRKKFKS